MKKSIRIWAIVVLFFNALGAIYGGGSLILDPTGKLLQLPIELLKSSPFQDFLIPGTILFTVNGLLNLLVGILGIRKSTLFPTLTILCGLTLIMWLTIQIIIIKQFFAPLHGLYYLVAIVMIFLGSKLRKQNIDYTIP